MTAVLVAVSLVQVAALLDAMLAVVCVSLVLACAPPYLAARYLRRRFAA